MAWWPLIGIPAIHASLDSCHAGTRFQQMAYRSGSFRTTHPLINKKHNCNDAQDKRRPSIMGNNSFPEWPRMIAELKNRSATHTHSPNWGTYLLESMCRTCLFVIGSLNSLQEGNLSCRNSLTNFKSTRVRQSSTTT